MEICTADQGFRMIPRWRILILAITSGLIAILTAAPVVAGQPGTPEWSTRSLTGFLFSFDPRLATTTSDYAPDAFLDRVGPVFVAAASELQLVLKSDPLIPIEIRVLSSETASGMMTGSEKTPVQPDTANATLLIDAPALMQLTDLEATNAIRAGVARILIARVSHYRLPAGFTEGFASYAQRPVTGILSRYAATVQNARTQNSLLTWDDLNSGRIDPTSELAQAENYAIIAYLFQRYTLPEFQQFLVASATEPDWKSALESAYGTSAIQLERAWRDNLPRWTNGDWKTNVIAAFDLDPARALLEQGNYRAAKSRLDSSVRLFADLGDEQRLAIAQELTQQCNIGLQAESLMTDTQHALEHHDYQQANDLLTQAETQYAQLPPEQRPQQTLNQYRALTNLGLSATSQFDRARRLAHSWTDYPEARASALAAGAQFAELGDAERVAATRDVLADIDRRQRRLVYLLGGLALISAVWLLLWRRTGAARQLHWPYQRRRTPQRPEAEWRT